MVPACVGEYTVRPQWELELMRMSLPAGNVPEPEDEAAALTEATLCAIVALALLPL